MRKTAWIAAWLVVVGLLASPTATAQADFEQALADMRFEVVELVVGPDIVEFRANEFRIQGNAASEFRTCLDGHDDCPVAELRGLIGNADGSVSSQEVSDFRELVKGIGSAVPEIKQFVDSLKPLVSVDGRPADVIGLHDLVLEDAEGPTASTAAITADFVIRAEYRSTVPSERHDVQVEPFAQDLTLTDRIVVRGADGWKVSEDSIRPAGMAGLYDDGRMEGSQADFEGQEPLTFQIEESSSSVMLWAASGLVLAAAGGLLAFFVYKRRKA